MALDTGVNVAYLGVDLPAAEIVAAAKDTQARVVGLSVVARKNHARTVQEIEAIQMMLPAGVELWLGGGDARQAATDIQAFRGWVVDDLRETEGELARIAAGANRSA